MLGCLLLGAAPARLTVYTAPAGNRPAGAPHALHPYDVILPNGRISAPVGTSVAVGTNALGLALSPGDRYVIVSNDDGRPSVPGAPELAGAPVRGYSLAVVDARTMRVVSVYAPKGASFYSGVAAFADPADPKRTLVLAAGGVSNEVDVFDLSATGRLRFEQAIPVPVALSTDAANAGLAFPGGIAVSSDHRTAYVANGLADTVTAIDVASRSVRATVGVGFFPDGLAYTHHRLYVTDSGLQAYAKLPQPAAEPEFANVTPAPYRASSLTGIALLPDGDLNADRSALTATRMDVSPDGVDIVGGAFPSAIVMAKDGRFAYVTMSNVDRVAVVDVLGEPRVVSGLQLRLFNLSPFGTQPDAIVRSPDGKRLYVALAGMNAVAVLDARNPVHLHRLGLIPTGWYPSALALSANGRFLFVANAKGNGTWATLQRIDLHRLPLEQTTISALKYNRVAHPAPSDALVPPLRSLKRSSAIRHVVFVLAQGDTLDEPNLRSLANRYASAQNFYADDDGSAAQHQFAGAATASVYTEKTQFVRGGIWSAAGGNDDPEDYPRAGYLFDAAMRVHLSYRDYGGLLRLSGYRAGRYTFDVPALAALANRVDLSYPLEGSNAAQAAEFVADFGGFERAGTVPDFTYVWLPADGAPQEAADSDAALGAIVQALESAPQWRSTAVFVVARPGTAQSSDPYRRIALVISPYAKPGYRSPRHLSFASVVKTEEELLGLPPLSLGDLLASDMADCFTPQSDQSAWHAERRTNAGR